MFHNPRLPDYSQSAEPLYMISIEKQSRFRALMLENSEHIQRAFGIILSPGEPSMPECLAVVRALRSKRRWPALEIADDMPPGLKLAAIETAVQKMNAARAVMKAVRAWFPGVLTKLSTVH